MKKMLLVYNPMAGDGRISAGLSRIVDTMTRAGFLVTVYPTQAPLDARCTIGQISERFERIVVCGGDGILHEAVNGWMALEHPPLLGYIPTGTVNDFASSHEIPRDLEQAAAIAAGPYWSALDIGRFNEEYFSYVAAFGLGTSVSYQTPQKKKQKLGSLAYLLEALNAVDFARWENNCETMKITWPDGSCEGDFLYGMVSNSRYVAGTDYFTRNLFNWHDGLLEGVFIRRPMNLAELNQIISCVVHSNFDHPLCVQVQASWFRFECDQTAWTLDGEYGGTHDSVTTQAVPGALSMILPQSHVLECSRTAMSEEAAHGQ